VSIDLSRREWLATVPAALALSSAPVPRAARADDVSPSGPFLLGLNTSTIMGQKLPITEVIAIAAKAGYHGLEPWIRELDAHQKSGGSLKDLRKRLEDAGLKVESAIGFFPWCVDDEAQRKKGFEEARRNMDLVREIGGKRLAAPPVGATDVSGMDPRKLAERYRSLLELGDEMGVVPEVEVWGFSKTLGRLSEAAQVAIDSGHPKACILPDVYHLYKGGSPPEGLRLLNGQAIPVIHMNDYPATPPRDQIKDAQRVFPGDGVAPLDQILRNLRDIGFRGMLSLEIFNETYWKQDPLVVARVGLEKMRTAVRKALG
jgi:2-keto-myo-inositol isomerase